MFALPQQALHFFLFFRLNFVLSNTVLAILPAHPRLLPFFVDQLPYQLAWEVVVCFYSFFDFVAQQ